MTKRTLDDINQDAVALLHLDGRLEGQKEVYRAIAVGGVAAMGIHWLLSKYVKRLITNEADKLEKDLLDLQ